MLILFSGAFSPALHFLAARRTVFSLADWQRTLASIPRHKIFMEKSQHL